MSVCFIAKLEELVELLAVNWEFAEVFDKGVEISTDLDPSKL